ncbi:hypothetical protein H0X06_06015 [Candidatus Dependentiae bacterium]|nr:hypothetical protein [Candidatus Dependentiae bacterium]
MNSIRQRFVFFLLIPFYVSCMEQSKSVVKQGNDFVFYKSIPDKPSLKEVGRIQSTQYSVEKICMLMNILALPRELQHYIALLFIGNQINSLVTLQLTRIFTGSIKQSPDEKIILTVLEKGGKDKEREVVFCDMASGDQIKSINYAHPLSLIQFSFDSKAVLLLGEPSKIGLWDIASGNRLCEFEEPCSVDFCSAEFSADDKTVLTGSTNGAAYLWDAFTGKQLQEFKGHQDRPILSVAFSPNGEAVLTVSYDEFNGVACLWDLSGNCISTFQGINLIKEVIFTSNDRAIFLAKTLLNKTYLCNREMGEQPKELERLPSEKLIMNADRSMILTVSDSDNTVCFNSTIAAEKVVIFKGHTGKIISVCMSSDGTMLLTGSDDHTARLWDASSGIQLCVFQGHIDSVVSAVFSSDGQAIVTGSSDGTIYNLVISSEP